MFSGFNHNNLSLNCCLYISSFASKSACIPVAFSACRFRSHTGVAVFVLNCDPLSVELWHNYNGILICFIQFIPFCSSMSYYLLLHSSLLLTDHDLFGWPGYLDIKRQDCVHSLSVFHFGGPQHQFQLEGDRPRVDAPFEDGSRHAQPLTRGLAITERGWRAGNFWYLQSRRWMKTHTSSCP